MKTRLLLTIAALMLCFGCGTFTVKPGSDPVVVYAEAAAEQSYNVFTAFLEWERNNEAALLKVNPQIHATANEIRQSGPGWIKELRTATKAYKQSKSDTNKTNLQRAQEMLDFAIQEVRQRMYEGKGSASISIDEYIKRYISSICPHADTNVVYCL